MHQKTDHLIKSYIDVSYSLIRTHPGRERERALLRATVDFGLCQSRPIRSGLRLRLSGKVLPVQCKDDSMLRMLTSDTSISRADEGTVVRPLMTTHQVFCSVLPVHGANGWPIEKGTRTTACAKCLSVLWCVIIEMAVSKGSFRWRLSYKGCKKKKKNSQWNGQLNNAWPTTIGQHQGGTSEAIMSPWKL